MSRLCTDNSPLSPRSLPPHRQILYLLFWGSLAILLILYAIRPIRDPDFWWHLKTGDLIIQHQELPRLDPFNYTGDGVVNTMQAVILYGYWLWEIGASLLYKTFGFPGILLLKISTATLLFGGVLYEMYRQRLSQIIMIVLIGLGTLVTINVYHLERPQVLSLFFTTLLIGMISRARTDRPPSVVLIPLMVLWANIHQGVVVGEIILVLAAAGFMIQYRRDRNRQRLMVSWAIAGILASFINPNGWNNIVKLWQVLHSSIGPYHVAEYRSSWQLFLLQSRSAAVCLWVLATLHMAGLVMASRRFWAEILVSLFVIILGLAYIRNTGFIAVSLLPMTGWYLEQGCARFTGKMPRQLPALACLLLATITISQTVQEWTASVPPRSPISNEFPVNMANFLKSSGISGRLFNDYNAGGYLNWALYPEWKTFIDGRELDTRVSWQYLKIARGSTEPLEGKPYYLEMLDRYKIDVVALRIALLDGRLQPLLKLLLQNPQWVPVYLDDQSFVMVRNSPHNAAAIGQYGLDRPYFLDMLALIIGNYAKNSPDALHLAVMYADILIYCGRHEESQHILQRLKASALSPELMVYLHEEFRSASTGAECYQQ